MLLVLSGLAGYDQLCAQENSADLERITTILMQYTCPYRIAGHLERGDRAVYSLIEEMKLAPGRHDTLVIEVVESDNSGYLIVESWISEFGPEKFEYRITDEFVLVSLKKTDIHGTEVELRLSDSAEVYRVVDSLELAGFNAGRLIQYTEIDTTGIFALGDKNFSCAIFEPDFPEELTDGIPQPELMKMRRLSQLFLADEMPRLIPYPLSLNMIYTPQLMRIDRGGLLRGTLYEIRSAEFSSMP